MSQARTIQVLLLTTLLILIHVQWNGVHGQAAITSWNHGRKRAQEMDPNYKFGVQVIRSKLLSNNQLKRDPVLKLFDARDDYPDAEARIEANGQNENLFYLVR